MLHWKSFKNDEKCFLFHLKNAFHSEDNWIFVLTFLLLLGFFYCCLFVCFYFVCLDGLIRNVRLILKSMTSQPCQQTITIHILPNTSWSKGNQAMKFVQVIEDNNRNIFLQKSSRKRARNTSSKPLVFFKNFVWDKSKCSAPLLLFFASPRLGHK